MGEVVAARPAGVIADMATRYGMDASAFERTLRNTVFPADAPKEQFAAFLLVAKEYGLNPIVKEVYAFPNRNGGIQPIVSIDGWIRIINNHPQFNGMTFVDNHDANGVLTSVTCRMHRKDREHPVEVTEYMSECRRETDPWKKWPARMLRHKTTIQAARYAFGFSGIVDPDEAERIIERDMGEASVTERTPPPKEDYPAEKFEKNFPAWKKAIEAGDKTPDEVIAMVQSRGNLTEEQKTKIRGCAKSEEAVEAEWIEDYEKGEENADH